MNFYIIEPGTRVLTLDKEYADIAKQRGFSSDAESWYFPKTEKLTVFSDSDIIIDRFQILYPRKQHANTGNRFVKLASGDSIICKIFKLPSGCVWQRGLPTEAEFTIMAVANDDIINYFINVSDISGSAEEKQQRIIQGLRDFVQRIIDNNNALT